MKSDLSWLNPWEDFFVTVRPWQICQNKIELRERLWTPIGNVQSRAVVLIVWLWLLDSQWWLFPGTVQVKKYFHPNIKAPLALYCIGQQEYRQWHYARPAVVVFFSTHGYFKMRFYLGMLLIINYFITSQRMGTYLWEVHIEHVDCLDTQAYASRFL